MLFVRAEDRAALADIRKRAEAAPDDMAAVQAALADPDSPARKAHRRKMESQSMPLQVGFMVTFSYEIGHPCGAVRHLSMSTVRAGKVPAFEAVKMVMAPLGFVGEFEACAVWLEDLSDGGKALNVAQPINAVN